MPHRRRGADDRHQRVILRDIDVGGEAKRQRPFDRPFQLGDAVPRRQLDRDAASRGGERYETIEIAVAEAVVRDRADPLQSPTRMADQMEHRQVLRPGPHHAIERRQFSHAIRRAQQRRSPDAGVTVGCVGGIQLRAATDPLDRGRVVEGVVERKGVIAWHSENMPDPQRHESLGDILHNRHRTTHPALS